MSIKKSKLSFASDDLDANDIFKKSPKKKVLKRQKVEEPGGVKLNTNQAACKKKKNDENNGIGSEQRHKLINVITEQIRTRKQTYENLLKSLMEVANNSERDYNTLKENEQKLEHLTGSFMKCIQQAANTQKHMWKNLKEIHNAFNKEFEEMENDHKAEANKLGEELEEDIRKLQTNLVAKIKRADLEYMQKAFNDAFRDF